MSWIIHPSYQQLDDAAVRGRGDVINLPGELAGSVGSAGQPTAYVSAIAGVPRSGQPQPAVPILPAGHNRFRTERVYDHFSRSECRAGRAGAPNDPRAFN